MPLEQQALPQEKKQLSKEELIFAEFEQEIDHVTRHINETNFERTGVLEDNIGEAKFHIQPPSARLGKHARVYFLDIEKPGKDKFECVLRDSVYDGERYLLNKKQKEIIAKYVPKLYAIKNGWVVMERLKGLELKDLTRRLESDEEFLKQYVKKVSEVMYDLSGQDISIDDVEFLTGHNCIADSNDASVKIIEQANLRPDMGGYGCEYAVNENLTHALMREFDHVRGLRSDQEPEPYAYDFYFQLIKNILQKVNPEDLIIRYRYLRPAHKMFRSQFGHLAWQGGKYDPITDEEYEKILQNPDNIIIAAASEMGSEGIGLNPELIQAVNQNDVEKFVALMKEKKYKVSLDKEDEKNKVIVG